MDIVLLYIGAYLVGSIPTAYIIGRLFRGMDIRRYGSGNVGASNLFEHVGKKWVVLLAFSEAIVKGAGPVWAGRYLLGLEQSSIVLIGPPLLAMIGNNWSPFLRFQGGRGIAVTTGLLLGFSPALLGVSAFIAIGGWAVTKNSGLWVLIALVLMPVFGWLLHGNLSLVWLSLGVLGIVVLKRLSSNWTPFPQGVSRRRVLFNRLVRDRDVEDRTQWVTRMPGAM